MDEILFYSFLGVLLEAVGLYEKGWPYQIQENHFLVKVYCPEQTMITPMTLNLVEFLGITGSVSYFSCPESLLETTYYPLSVYKCITFIKLKSSSSSL